VPPFGGVFTLTDTIRLKTKRYNIKTEHMESTLNKLKLISFSVAFLYLLCNIEKCSNTPEILRLWVDTGVIVMIGQYFGIARILLTKKTGHESNTI
tara:strand:- start:674 stop:961 length:288 start_codon:yes stop_codon:yes gene_type:complete